MQNSTPLALAQKGGFAEGLGVHLGANYTRAITELTQAEGATPITFTGDVLEAWAGISYRLVLWDALNAGDFTLDVGYQYDQFPLQGLGFPGVIYDGVYVGGLFSFPLSVPWLRLEAGGRFQAWIRSRGDLLRLGNDPSSLAFDTTLAVRFEWKILEFGVLGFYQQRGLTVTGLSTLDGLAAFSDARFVDRRFGAELSVGIRLPALPAK